MKFPRTIRRWNSPRAAGGDRSFAFALVAVLVIVMLLSMLVISLLFRFQAEDSAASASLSGEQAWAAAMSGVEEALRVAGTAAPGATDWQDNPGAFRERLVFDDGGERWFFSVFSSGTQPGEVVLRTGRGEVVAAGLGERQEFRGQLHADRVAADVLLGGIAAAVAEKAG